MSAPLGRPIFPPSEQGHVARIGRRVSTLERRAVSRWVYVGGNPSNDQTGIDATAWSDPNVPAGFSWQHGWLDNGTSSSTDDGLTRYRLGASGLEMALNAIGGSLGTVMFTLLPNYWNPQDGKQTFTAADSTGQFTCFTIVPQGPGSVYADVYAGRV